MDLSFDESAFSGSVPLFPLPRLVLLPGGLLPLHVFEQRYRDMLRDARASERLIGMALLKPGYEAEYHGAPAIEDHVCIGRIALDQELPDGRWNLVLVGVRRARVVQEDQSRTYRVASVELLSDIEPASTEQAVLAQRLAAGLSDVPTDRVRDPKRMASARELLGSVPEVIPLGMAVDLVADALALALPDRLALLRTPEVAPRAEALAEALRSLPSEPKTGSAWPPEFSSN